MTPFRRWLAIAFVSVSVSVGAQGCASPGAEGENTADPGAGGSAGIADVAKSDVSDVPDVPDVPATTCGNGVCDAAESCSTCAGDCGVGASAADSSLDAEERAFLVLLNAYRADRGLGQLRACASLARAAQGHAETMRDASFVGHTSPDGRKQRERGCDACYVGACEGELLSENVAAGHEDAQATFDQWRKSSGHNANMLREGLVVVGIGRATGGGKYPAYWATAFGGVDEASCAGP